MATDSLKNSFGDEISFSEWQFVGKNNSEYSDDESIEIIEREILCSETSSSSSEEEEEKDEPDFVIKEEKEDEPEIGEWVVPFDSNSCICLDSDDESLPNNTLDIETSQNDNDQNTLHCSYTPKESYVTATSINNNFSRKVLYSCVLAAVIGVIIHQYRGHLLDVLLNRSNETKSEGTDHSSRDGFLCTGAGLQQKLEYFKISSHDAVVQNLVDEKREEFKKLCQKYEMILGNTFHPKSNTYVVEVSILRKLLTHPDKHLSTTVYEPCEKDVYNTKVPTVCTDSSGKVFLSMTKKEYYRIIQLLSDTARFDRDELFHLYLNHLLKVDRDSETDRHVINLVDESPAENPTISSNADDAVLSDMPKISAQNPTTSTKTNKADLSGIPEKTDAESKLQEVIEEVRMLYRKIKNQVENLDRLWTTCTDNKQDSCILRRKSVTEQNEAFSNEAKKTNTTHTEKSKSDDSVLEFIYQTAPVTDRWTLERDSKTSDTNQYDRSNEELLIKMGKAREKYKRHKEKSERRKAQKTRKLNGETEHKLYKRYKEFLSQTREKMKVDYKKFASHFKSKLKKFGDGVKRNYEKLISSDWKHYAKSVFQSFHF